MSNQTPYTKAAGAYGSVAAETNQRVMEGQILLKAAQKLEDLAKRLGSGEKATLAEIEETLNFNRKLWELFLNDMQDPNHLLPQDIKNNVGSLAVFVFKRTLETLIETTPEKLTVLININRNIASGLMKKPSVAAPAAGKKNPEAETRKEFVSSEA